MSDQILLKNKILFAAIKIITGSAVVIGLVVLAEWAERALLDQTQLPGEIKNLIVAVTEALLVLYGYIVLFKFLEKRPIQELSASTFLKFAVAGFSTGVVLQSLAIAVLYLAGGYSITQVNPVSFMLPSLAFALTAGFVAEILLRGILFRVIEEVCGTLVTIIIFVFLFAAMHINSKGASWVSVLATCIYSGILLSAVFVYTRSLWLPIFIHFAWDFTEPGIYGGINPGISTDKSLFYGKITGSYVLTGGEAGPGNSLQSAILCLLASLLFLWLAKRRGNFIKPYWKR